jgi:hypothetical protein
VFSRFLKPFNVGGAPWFTGDHVQEINRGTSHAVVVKNLLERLFYPDFSVSIELHDSLPLAARHHIADELL